MKPVNPYIKEFNHIEDAFLQYFDAQEWEDKEKLFNLQQLHDDISTFLEHYVITTLAEAAKKNNLLESINHWLEIAETASLGTKRLIFVEAILAALDTNMWLATPAIQEKLKKLNKQIKDAKDIFSFNSLLHQIKQIDKGTAEEKDNKIIEIKHKHSAVFNDLYLDESKNAWLENFIDEKNRAQILVETEKDAEKAHLEIYLENNICIADNDYKTIQELIKDKEEDELDEIQLEEYEYINESNYNNKKHWQAYGTVRHDIKILKELSEKKINQLRENAFRQIAAFLSYSQKAINATPNWTVCWYVILENIIRNSLSGKNISEVHAAILDWISLAKICDKNSETLLLFLLQICIDGLNEEIVGMKALKDNKLFTVEKNQYEKLLSEIAVFSVSFPTYDEYMMPKPLMRAQEALEFMFSSTNDINSPAAEYLYQNGYFIKWSDSNSALFKEKVKYIGGEAPVFIDIFLDYWKNNKKDILKIESLFNKYIFLDSRNNTELLNNIFIKLPNLTQINDFISSLVDYSLANKKNMVFHQVLNVIESYIKKISDRALYSDEAKQKNYETIKILINYVYILLNNASESNNKEDDVIIFKEISSVITFIFSQNVINKSDADGLLVLLERGIRSEKSTQFIEIIEKIVAVKNIHDQYKVALKELKEDCKAFLEEDKTASKKIIEKHLNIYNALKGNNFKEIVNNNENIDELYKCMSGKQKGFLYENIKEIFERIIDSKGSVITNGSYSNIFFNKEGVFSIALFLNWFIKSPIGKYYITMSDANYLIDIVNSLVSKGNKEFVGMDSCMYLLQDINLEKNNTVDSKKLLLIFRSLIKNDPGLSNNFAQQFLFKKTKNSIVLHNIIANADKNDEKNIIKLLTNPSFKNMWGANLKSLAKEVFAYAERIGSFEIIEAMMMIPKMDGIIADNRELVGFYSIHNKKLITKLFKDITNLYIDIIDTYRPEHFFNSKKYVNNRQILSPFTFLTELSNKISNNVSDNILLAPNKEIRIMRISQFLMLAWHSFHHGNHDLAQFILAAIDSTPIKRLWWDKNIEKSYLPKEVDNLRLQILDILDTVKNGGDFVIYKPYVEEKITKRNSIIPWNIYVTLLTMLEGKLKGGKLTKLEKKMKEILKVWDAYISYTPRSKNNNLLPWQEFQNNFHYLIPLDENGKLIKNENTGDNVNKLDKQYIKNYIDLLLEYFPDKEIKDLEYISGQTIENLFNNILSGPGNLSPGWETDTGDCKLALEDLYETDEIKSKFRGSDKRTAITPAKETILYNYSKRILPSDLPAGAIKDRIKANEHVNYIINETAESFSNELQEVKTDVNDTSTRGMQGILYLDLLKGEVVGEYLASLDSKLLEEMQKLDIGNFYINLILSKDDERCRNIAHRYANQAFIKLVEKTTKDIPFIENLLSNKFKNIKAWFLQQEKTLKNPEDLKLLNQWKWYLYENMELAKFLEKNNLSEKNIEIIELSNSYSVLKKKIIGQWLSFNNNAYLYLQCLADRENTEIKILTAAGGHVDAADGEIAVNDEELESNYRNISVEELNKKIEVYGKLLEEFFLIIENKLEQDGFNLEFFEPLIKIKDHIKFNDKTLDEIKREFFDLKKRFYIEFYRFYSEKTNGANLDYHDKLNINKILIDFNDLSDFSVMEESFDLMASNVQIKVAISELSLKITEDLNLLKSIVGLDKLAKKIFNDIDYNNIVDNFNSEVIDLTNNYLSSLKIIGEMSDANKYFKDNDGCWDIISKNKVFFKAKHDLIIKQILKYTVIYDNKIKNLLSEIENFNVEFKFIEVDREFDAWIKNEDYHKENKNNIYIKFYTYLSNKFKVFIANEMSLYSNFMDTHGFIISNSIMVKPEYTITECIQNLKTIENILQKHGILSFDEWKNAINIAKKSRENLKRLISKNKKTEAFEKLQKDVGSIGKIYQLYGEKFANYSGYSLESKFLANALSCIGQFSSMWNANIEPNKEDILAWPKYYNEIDNKIREAKILLINALKARVCTVLNDMPTHADPVYKIRLEKILDNEEFNKSSNNSEQESIIIARYFNKFNEKVEELFNIETKINNLYKNNFYSPSQSSTTSSMPKTDTAAPSSSSEMIPLSLYEIVYLHAAEKVFDYSFDQEGNEGVDLQLPNTDVPTTYDDMETALDSLRAFYADNSDQCTLKIQFEHLDKLFNYIFNRELTPSIKNGRATPSLSACYSDWLTINELNQLLPIGKQANMQYFHLANEKLHKFPLTYGSGMSKELGEQGADFIFNSKDAEMDNANLSTSSPAPTPPRRMSVNLSENI